MKRVRVVNRTRGLILGSEVAVADRWWLRLRGLLGRKHLRPGEGLLLTPCSSVHTFGMRFPIDVVFLAVNGEVVAVYPGMRPGRTSPLHRKARQTLELPHGTLEETGTAVGDLLHFTGAA
jgi:uncharacterized membrane protein (UPF0127 family)